MRKLPYRPCAGIVLANARGKIFVGQRIDNNFDAWQMPQGGIDKGETPIVAAKRELFEETGILTELVDYEDEFADWLHYDLPENMVSEIWGGRFQGQKQKWFLFRFKGIDSDVNIHTKHPEFSKWMWMDSSDVIKNAVYFKKDTYTQVLQAFAGRL